MWDSQLGTPAPSTAASRAPLDDEDFDEPEIPEYLIAERRGSGGRGGQGGGRGGARGGRGAYQSAMERERYGGRGGSGGVGGGGGGINRYPDVSGRTRSSLPPREDRAPVRRDERPAAVRSSNEPWSDVPPELEALLRAQVASKPAPSRPTGTASAASAADEIATPVVAADSETTVATTGAKPRATRKPAAKATGEKATAKPRASRKAASAATGTGASDGGPEVGSSVGDAEGEPVAKAAAKPRATRKPAAAKSAEAASASVEATATIADADAEPAVAPKRRSTRKTATTDPA